MVEPVTTAAAVTLGAGAWFASKVLGPSAEALGDSLRAYLEARIPVIFARAEEITRNKCLEPNAIKPGLFAKMVMSASMSEDVDEITEWWANLFVDASMTGSNQHAVFSDIMAQIGPAEAALFDELLRPFTYLFDEAGADGRRMLSSTPNTGLDHELRRMLGDIPINQGEPIELLAGGHRLNFTWPVWISWVSIPRIDGNGHASTPTTGLYITTKDPVLVDTLVRVGLLRNRSLTITKSENIQADIHTVHLTPLGAEFYRAVTGRINMEEL